VLRIENAEHAKSVVRKYIAGTRSRYPKITSIVIEEEATPPDKDGMWTIKGTYTTEENEQKPFRARVTPRGEVLMTNLSSKGVGRKTG
jgi:hypothetical protein